MFVVSLSFEAVLQCELTNIIIVTKKFNKQVQSIGIIAI